MNFVSSKMRKNVYFSHHAHERRLTRQAFGDSIGMLPGFLFIGVG